MANIQIILKPLVLDSSRPPSGAALLCLGLI